MWAFKSDIRLNSWNNALKPHWNATSLTANRSPNQVKIRLSTRNESQPVTDIRHKTILYQGVKTPICTEILSSKTRKHFSRMRNACFCGSREYGPGRRGGCGASGGGRYGLRRVTILGERHCGRHYPVPCGQNDICLWKHYLPATSFPGDNKIGPNITDGLNFVTC